MAEAVTPAFEPERGRPEAPDREPEVEDFADRELGMLVDQGNFERARVLLARSSAARRADAAMYIDAIRVERSAAPGGRAWEAWASRAFEERAPIAEALLRLVPKPALSAYLVEHKLGWSALGQQSPLSAARDLLRLRLEPLALRDPGAALLALEEPGLVQAARTDGVLRGLALAALAAGALAEPARVRALSAEYPAGPDESAPGAFAPLARAQLKEALRVQPAFARAFAQTPCPPALERALRSGPCLSRAAGRRLREELRAELRARPREYERAIDAIARPDLLAFAERSLAVTVTQRAEVGTSAAAAASPNEALAALDRLLADAARELRRGMRARVWPASITAVLLGSSALLAFAGARGAWLAIAVMLLLVPIRRAIDRALYHDLRPRLVRAVIDRQLAIAPVARALAASNLPRRDALAARLARDSRLSVLAALSRGED